MKVVCEFCGTSLDTRASIAMKQVIGWVEPGKNATKLMTDGAGWAHKYCVLMESKKRKGQFQQVESLF